MLHFYKATFVSDVTWVLEPNIFEETHPSLRRAILDQGHRLIEWSDAWWSDGIPAFVPDSAVVFHGSLGNAARIAEELSWSPGSFCPVTEFHCSSWYESARQWIVNANWIICPANELVASARHVADRLGANDRLFIRPDSPLKPFSGRVVAISELSLAKLDYGFYYDDETIPVVAAPVREIGKEWRFVVVDRSVVAGSAYEVRTRKAASERVDLSAAAFASTIASHLSPPSAVYTLDVCECDGQFRMLELNPFGGADLYACNPDIIVESVSKTAAAFASDGSR